MLSLEENAKRQKQLLDLLYKMAKECISNDEIEGICAEIKKIYSNSFRHEYASFFSVDSPCK